MSRSAREHALQSLRFANASGQDWLSSLLKTHSGRERAAARDVEAAFFADAEEADVPPFDRFEADEAACRYGRRSISRRSSTWMKADCRRARPQSGALGRGAPPSAARLCAPQPSGPISSALRDKANQRMQLANMLLDRRRKEIEAGR